jgi:2-amino-4-hydroxy-6-hydroxymethyldihydropteridine diphosphokinase
VNARRVTACIGLGSNLDDPAAQVRAGIAALDALAGSRVLSCSALYRTAPVGVAAQPDFINAVCLLETSLDAASLMRALLEVERRHGRVRGAEKGGPRTLDLDLLLYGEEILDSPEVTVPHPRLHERAFVLAPLAELAPDLVVPGRGPVRALLAACAGQRVERLES